MNLKIRLCNYRLESAGPVRPHTTCAGPHNLMSIRLRIK